MTKSVLAAVSAAAMLDPLPPSPQQPAAEALIEAGRSYLASYLPRVPGTLLEERYTVMDVAGGRMQMPERITSDIMLLNFDGKAMSLRDAYAVGGAKTREAGPRLSELLSQPTQARWDLALSYDDESKKYFLAETIMRLNDPLLVLRFMSPSTASTFQFTVDGRQKLNGVETIGLRFTEARGIDVTYVLDTRGNAAVSGRFWIDPATGAVHKTELWADSKTEVARIAVSYAPDARLNLLLPSKTTETYEERPLPGGPREMGKGAGANSSRGGFHRFEANATYSNPRYSRVDLSKAR